MMYYSGDWAWWAWIPMSVMMIAFWGAVAWAVVALVRRSGEPGGEAGPPARTPEAILQDRLARGEIDVGEYEERLQAIRGASPRVTG